MGLDKRCFSGPRPPHLWMETIELFFMSRWPHTCTNCQGTFQCPAAAKRPYAKLTFQETGILHNKAMIAVFDCINYCCSQDNITWVQVNSMTRSKTGTKGDVAKSKPSQSRIGIICGDCRQTKEDQNWAFFQISKITYVYRSSFPGCVNHNFCVSEEKATVIIGFFLGWQQSYSTEPYSSSSVSHGHKGLLALTK